MVLCCGLVFGIAIPAYSRTGGYGRMTITPCTIGGIFCDLHQAFDCVSCDILLSKMQFYGISGKANNLIISYLQDKYQRVLVNLITRSLGIFTPYPILCGW